MKKLLSALFLFFTLFINACETNNVSKISREVKVIGKCCKEVPKDNHKSARALKEEEAALSHSVSTILPAYFWDTKSMIW